MTGGTCPICSNKIIIEPASSAKGPLGGKRTAYCIFCGISFIEKRRGAFESLNKAANVKSALPPPVHPVSAVELPIPETTKEVEIEPSHRIENLSYLRSR